MRYIFIDEAGTSTKEPVTVVVGIIANADDHILAAENLIQEILGAVPKNLKSDFVFHAFEVHGNQKYQESEWALTDRLELLYQMMQVPRRIEMAITISVIWRGANDWSKSYLKHGLSPAQGDHVQAFMWCIGISDRNIRNNAGPREVAAVVAEEVPEMQKYLRGIPKALRENPTSIKRSFMRKTVSDQEAGYLTQKGDMRVTRIRNSVYFAEKDEDPLIQVADACAYGVRRYFAGQKFGLDFVRAILGDEKLLRNFGAPGSVECFWPQTKAKTE